MNPDSTLSNTRRLAIAVRGVVQGVGFRPFVYNAARARGLLGWVRNEADVVRIEVQGSPADLDAFCDALQHSPPPQAAIDAIEIVEMAPLPDATAFEIHASSSQASPRPSVPADLATCGDCLAEIRTPGERRYRYPFTNCTNCGPRWSIVESLPYDRPRTSMSAFAMCDDCRREYEDPTDRRFHAQPIACPVCGPHLELLDADGKSVATRDAALAAAVQAVLDGAVLALKGLGGFQLIVDATNADAVAMLRRRKRRPDRPFALMLPSVEAIAALCELSNTERGELESPRAPILLLRRRFTDRKSVLRDFVAPGNPYLGVMLPYTPLHHLLMEAVARPIVCTSGNLSEEPMAITTEDALQRLGTIADVFLVHDRPIVRPVDDSVARVDSGHVQLLRRARGYAPRPIALGEEGPSILAVGGHLKNTVAVAVGGQAVISPHVGDLDSVASVEVHRRAIDDLVEFFRLQPAAVACDLHPDYASTREAERLAALHGVPLVRIQHHHAHVAACMAENAGTAPFFVGETEISPRDVNDEKGDCPLSSAKPDAVLGFAWDGTGYGSDGTVWGGEALECRGSEFRRVGHLRTFALPGGDRAAREPRRSAVGVLYEMGVRKEELEGDSPIFAGQKLGQSPGQKLGQSPGELDTFWAMLQRGLNSPRTSSMGRLFDAVAALCGLPACASHTRKEQIEPPVPAAHRFKNRCYPVISFEGQAAMALEFAADWAIEAAYPLPLSGDGTIPMVANWEPMIRGVLADRAQEVPLGTISAKVHNALAAMAVETAQRWGGRRVVLSGGCFQNALLTDRVRRRLLADGFEVYTHKKVPPGDGCIALGQLWIAKSISRLGASPGSVGWEKPGLAPYG